MAYSDFLGTQTNNFAEVFAAIRGLEICLEYGYMNVWLEMVAITLVSELVAEIGSYLIFK